MPLETCTYGKIKVLFFFQERIRGVGTSASDAFPPQSCKFSSTFTWYRSKLNSHQVTSLPIFYGNEACEANGRNPQEDARWVWSTNQLVVRGDSQPWMHYPVIGLHISMWDLFHSFGESCPLIKLVVISWTCVLTKASEDDHAGALRHMHQAGRINELFAFEGEEVWLNFRDLHHVGFMI